MTAPDLTPEQRELSEADHDALVDTICLALPQPHRGTCNRVADAVAPTVARMVADARAVGDRQGAARALGEAAAAARGMHDPVTPDCAEWADWLDARARAATSEEGSQA